MAIAHTNFKRGKVEINYKTHYYEIKIDGKNINGVRQIFINAGVDRVPSVLLDIIPSELSINTNDKEMVTIESDLSNLTLDDLMREFSKRIKIDFKNK